MVEISLALKVFGIWYLAFGIGAFFPLTNEPFFSRSPSSWDSLHESLLAFAGLYTIQCSIWSLTAAYFFPKRSAAFCLSLQLILVVAVASWIQLTNGIFSQLGLLAFFFDACFAALFLQLAFRGAETRRKT